MTDRLLIRAATTVDAPAIAAVHGLAFPTPAEALLVARLAADGDALVSLLADGGESIVGHVMFSAMMVTADDIPVRAAGLAPVAVLPERQRAGIGGNLINAGLDALAASGVEIVFVLGDPKYYRRFGFDAAVAARFSSPFAGRHLMAQWLVGERPVARGNSAYAAAFGRMGEAE